MGGRGAGWHGGSYGLLYLHTRACAWEFCEGNYKPKLTDYGSTTNRHLGEE